MKGHSGPLLHAQLGSDWERVGTRAAKVKKFVRVAVFWQFFVPQWLQYLPVKPKFGMEHHRFVIARHSLFPFPLVSFFSFLPVTSAFIPLPSVSFSVPFPIRLLSFSCVASLFLHPFLFYFLPCLLLSLVFFSPILFLLSSLLLPFPSPLFSPADFFFSIFHTFPISRFLFLTFPFCVPFSLLSVCFFLSPSPLLSSRLTPFFVPRRGSDGYARAAGFALVSWQFLYFLLYLFVCFPSNIENVNCRDLKNLECMYWL